MESSAAVAETVPASASLGWRVALLVFAIVAVAHSLSPSVQVGDSRLSVPVATQVIRHHTLDLSGDHLVTSLPNQYDVRRVHGRLLPFFPWPAMLFAIPGSVAADVVGKDPETLRPSNPNQTWKIEVPTASVLVALTAVVLALVAFDSAPGGARARRRFAIAVALVYAFSTGAWSTGSRALWQHTPSMLFLSLALLAALRIDRHRAWSVALGMSLAAGYAVRPTDAVAVACFIVWLLVTRRRELLRVALGLVVVLVPFVVVNLVAFHALLPSYYSGNRLGTEAAIGFFDSAAMLLVSPSRGLLIYDPIIIAAAAGVWLKVRRGSFTALDFALGAVVIGQLVVVAAYGSTGGSSYGPRLMTDALPFIVYLSIPALDAVFRGGVRAGATGGRRAVTVAMLVVLVWGVAVNASGALLRSSYCWSASPVLVDKDPSRIWDWSDPQFLRPVKDLRDGMSLHDVVLESCTSS